MSTLRVIKSEDQHLAYLARIEDLVLRGDRLTATEVSELELLTVIVEAYESSRYPIDPVDPIEAIKFRMQEKGLKQSDLVPFIGGSGRVSEVLSRKRPLTVAMIRSLSNGLGISADVLIGTEDAPHDDDGVDWSKFPVREILARGWLGDIGDAPRDLATQHIKMFVRSAGLGSLGANFRRRLSGNADSPTSTYALYAWIARVTLQARKQAERVGTFHQHTLDENFLKELAHLSWLDSGPRLAVEYLQKNGISVVIEPHLRGTHLDGAAIKDSSGTPVIGLTLRYDRLDYFWFTLLHEVAHLWRHPFDEGRTYVDDVSRPDTDQKEAEANKIASEAFIPRLEWRRSEAYLNPTRQNIEAFASRLRIHPAIIVGRLQRERGDYSLFRDLVGQGEVRVALGL